MSNIFISLRRLHWLTSIYKHVTPINPVSKGHVHKQMSLFSQGSKILYQKFTCINSSLQLLYKKTLVYSIVTYIFWK